MYPQRRSQYQNSLCTLTPVARISNEFSACLGFRNHTHGVAAVQAHCARAQVLTLRDDKSYAASYGDSTFIA